MKGITYQTLLDAKNETLKNGVDLLNQLQGEGLFAPNYLELGVQDPHSYIVGAFDNQRLIGVAVAQVLDNLDYYTLLNEDFVKNHRHKKVGSLSTMSVHEDYQGQGIGQKLAKLRMEWLKDQGCQMTIGVSWVSGKKHTSDRVFLKMGFQEIGRHPTFYAQASLEKHFICPTCGEPPCLCPAILFAKQDIEQN